MDKNEVDYIINMLRTFKKEIGMMNGAFSNIDIKQIKKDVIIEKLKKMEDDMEKAIKTIIPCDECKGFGYKTSRKKILGNEKIVHKNCSACKGTGMKYPFQESKSEPEKQ